VNELSDIELDRYARHIVLREVGGVGQRKLKAASIAIIGAGGIGSAVIPALAGAGVGRLTIIDSDVIERSNLQRQTLFRDDQIGQSKAANAAEFVRALNPDIDARGLEDRLDPDNSERLLQGHDLVLDGSDNFATRLSVNQTCFSLQIPLVSAAAGQFQGQVGLFRGWESDQPCYRCFVGDAFDAEDCDNCAELGVLGALCGSAGNLSALMAISSLLGIGENGAGRLLLLDGISLSLKSIRIPKDRSCGTCGGAGAKGA
jgi:molybdopterin/thiamine biosynthesis adenylyltransferase